MVQEGIGWPAAASFFLITFTQYFRHPRKARYYTSITVHCSLSLGRLDVGLIELKRPRNGDPSWIWNCKIWKNHKPQKMKSTG